MIVAPQRGHRPQMPGPGESPQKRPRFDPSCPFCPGHEGQLPGIIAETPAPDAPSVRIVPNKFPALQQQQATQARACGTHQARLGTGIHEVIIESPWHDAEPATMPADELSTIVGVYRER